MRFGFDIDDTLINLREHAFHIYNQKLHQNVSIEIFKQLKTVEIHEAFGLDKVAGGKMWASLLEEIYFTNCQAFDGAIELLNRLHQDGHEIFYITSRPKGYCTRTKQWVEERGVPVKAENFYCGMEDHEKIHIIKELKLDYYFDDKPQVINTLTDIPTKLFVKDQSYNQHINLPRIKNWFDFKFE